MSLVLQQILVNAKKPDGSSYPPETTIRAEIVSVTINGVSMPFAASGNSFVYGAQDFKFADLEQDVSGNKIINLETYDDGISKVTYRITLFAYSVNAKVSQPKIDVVKTSYPQYLHTLINIGSSTAPATNPTLTAIGDITDQKIDALTTDVIEEGTANKYFTAARVWATILTAIVFTTNAAITAVDSVLVAFGKLQAQITAIIASLLSHTLNTSNPHSVTKSQVQLGNADNTSDVNKPVSSRINPDTEEREDYIQNPVTIDDYLPNILQSIIDGFVTEFNNTQVQNLRGLGEKFLSLDESKQAQIMQILGE